mmetsp:Transcript_6099/g.11341  ORF Transcript_6099/g.11341 Transcript_6099/m.11341 type:complete len:111 (+) Transcript_6099:93-425(+)
MAQISVDAVEGFWHHNKWGKIEVKVEPSGEQGSSVDIIHPLYGSQKMEINEFIKEDKLDFFGFKGALHGNKIIWDNGVSWTKIENGQTALSQSLEASLAALREHTMLASG